jgi:hypothetical protein
MLHPSVCSASLSTLGRHLCYGSLHNTYHVHVLCMYKYGQGYHLNSESGMQVKCYMGDLNDIESLVYPIWCGY